MPGKIKVKVLAGRNLPVMDRASDTTDAFVEIKFGGVTHKTDVCRKSLNPHWNSTEWYRFEVDESELQDEPLQLRLMDHDTYSANDAIGKVVISLAPLLARETAVPNKGVAAVSSGAVMSGWIPVFDTMHGIRGELNVIVKVELFSDFNKYKTSSCGVQFFHCPMIPPGYRATSVHGFVEELVVNDDPEYQWIDKIRTPRASNEARQVAFIKLSNQVQRLVGLKAAELGANAVVGYQQDFDLEGEAGVVARAIGTAVSISPLPTPSYPLNVPPCSQQQLKQYLDILSTDNENVGDLNHYFSTHQDELQKLVNILHPKYSSNFLDEGENPDDDDQSMHLRRQSSIKSYTDSISIYQDDFASQSSFKSLSKDQTDLNKLLNRIDQANDPNRNDSSDSDSSGPLQTIKKIKSNFFTKRLGSLRSRKNEKPSDDQVSIKSNSSDTSKISLTDIRNEFKKFKRNLKPKKPKFRKPFKNMEDVGVGMASILARSVIHAHTSLACIAETQDSEASPSSTLRRTSESEPTINVTDEEKIAPKIVTEVLDETDETDAQKLVPEIRCASLLNINIESGDDTIIHRIRKTSESCPTTPVANRTPNFLTLPGEQGYFGSVSSALSGDSTDMYSSSEEDDESSDPSAERSIETTSSVVQTVLNQEVNPNIVAQMEKKLSVLEMASELDTGINDDLPKLETVNAPELENNKNEQLEEASTSETFVIEKSSVNHHFKFHNPFTHKKSISAPSSPVEKKGSFVYRSSKRIRLQFSKLSQNSMIKSLSHYSLRPKKKHLETTTAMSQPGSSSDVPSKAPSHETVLGSPFLSYTDLMSLDKESAEAIKSLYKSDELPLSKVKMYIGSEPASRASVSGPSSPYYGTSGLSSPFHGKDDYHFSEQRSQKRERKPSIKPTGLIHTAMETLLIDKVQSLLLPTSSEPNAKEKKFFDDVNQKLEIVEESQKSVDKIIPKLEIIKNRHKVEQNIEIVAEKSLHKIGELPLSKGKMCIGSEPISRASISGLSSPYHETSDLSSPFHGKDDYHSSEQRLQKGEKTPSIKPTGLIHTAMETLLMDKVQSLLLPTSPEPNAKEKNFFDDVNQKLEIVEESQKSVDKIYPESQIIDNKNKVEQNIETVKEKSLYKGGELPCSKEELYIGLEPVSRASESGPSSPYHGTSGLSSPFHGKNDYHCSEQRSHKTDKKPCMKPTGLIHTAMETLLIDKVQSLLLPSSPEPNAKAKQFFNDVNQKLEIVEEARKSIDKINHEPNIIDDKDKATQKAPTIEEEELRPLTINEKEPQTEIINEKDQKNNGKKLTRQDSIHSQTESPSWSRKMSKEIEPNLVIPCKTIIQCTPVLQNFHPILSGSSRPLETIPSLPETASIDRPQSLDIDGLPDDTTAISVSVSSDQCSASTNCVSVCDNTHAACRAIVGRSERDKDIKDKEKDKGSPKHTRHESYNKDSLLATSGGAVQNSSLNATSTPVGMHRRSSDSDLSVTPKGSSLNASGNAGSGGGAILRPSMNSNNLDLLEYPFLTMTEYPPGFIVHLGGCVCARSVKLVDGGGESAARAAWWAELRTELRAHTRALRCNAVIAYTETTAICEDVCVLSASGTAAVINLDCDFNADIDAVVTVHNGSKTTIEEVETQSSEYCGIAHVPYSPGPGPHGADLSHCGGCRRARVPSVLLATCAKPNRLTSYAKAVTLTAVAARVRRAPPQAEPGARDISDQLPFLEYELHKLLLAKLRMQGANALFNLQTQIAIGERCVMALATGTAVRLGALPPPTPPRIKASENDKDALEMQRALWDTFTANKTANGYDHIPELGPAGALSVTETEERPVLELCADKDAALLELDEAEDVETARFLAARRTHMQVYCNGMKTAPGKPPQAFAQVWRARLNLTMQGGGATAAAERHVARALDGITYKLRRLRPCVLMAPRFQLELPEDEIQLVLSGAAIQLQDPNKPELNGHHDNANNNVASSHPSIVASGPATSYTTGQSGQGSSHGQGGAGDADDDIFTLDEEQASPPRVPVSTEVVEENKPVSNGPQQPMAVSLTSVSHISTGRCARRVCALRLLFVRETTAVRELGGLSGFLHTFTAEVMAIVRAYTAALGGNALTSFYITQLMLQDNAHKNQGQCLLSVGGDVVQIMY